MPSILTVVAHIDPPSPAGGIFFNSGRRGSLSRSASDAGLGTDGAVIQPRKKRNIASMRSLMRVAALNVPSRGAIISAFILQILSSHWLSQP